MMCDTPSGLGSVAAKVPLEDDARRGKLNPELADLLPSVNDPRAQTVLQLAAGQKRKRLKYPKIICHWFPLLPISPLDQHEGHLATPLKGLFASPRPKHLASIQKKSESELATAPAVGQRARDPIATFKRSAR
jgi:hypothetical protein